MISMGKISRASVESANDGYFERMVKMNKDEMTAAEREFHDPVARNQARVAWAKGDVVEMTRIFAAHGKYLDGLIDDLINDCL